MSSKDGATDVETLETEARKVIKVNGDRMTPEILRELISKNPDKVCSALRNWSSIK